MLNDFIFASDVTEPKTVKKGSDTYSKLFE
jgi:hypothetical protein